MISVRTFRYEQSPAWHDLLNRTEKTSDGKKLATTLDYVMPMNCQRIS
jgi:hypothetical protein